MTDDSPPPTDSGAPFRDRTFRTGRRGYDRTEVDAFRTEAAERVEELERRLAAAETLAAGMTAGEDGAIRSELDAVKDEVGRIVQSARDAAEGMRTRAVRDSTQLRADAETRAATTRRTAEADAETVRKEAWETGTELLAQAQAAAAGLYEEAQKDVLFIRAEAEQEALRLTADARRQAEDAMRAARGESDRTVAAAQVQAQQMLDEARQQAEAARERARALEERRGELMGELEAAQESIGRLELEIEARRLALEGGHADEAAPDGAPDLVDADWDEEGSVRLLPPVQRGQSEAIDAEAMAAEVQRLREQEAAREQVEPKAVAPEPVVPAPVEPEAAVEPEAVAPEPVVPAPVEPEVAVEPVEPGPEVAVEPAEPEPEVAVEPVEPEPEVAVEPEPEVAVEPEVVFPEPAPRHGNDLAALFARLREPRAEPVAVNDTTVAEPAAADAAEEATAGSVDAAAAALELSAEDAAAGSADAAAAALEPSAGDGSPAGGGAVALDPFDVRDRLLLPIENRALRGVKRSLVDLQNRVLEDLRVAGGRWTVDHAMFMAAMHDDLRTLTAESVEAGHAAAAALVGLPPVQPPNGRRSPDPTPAFVDGLAGAVSDAVDRVRTAGGGARQIAAAASRVFRAWRTDEAERRLRRASFAAYHEGVLAAFPAAGVASVAVVTFGRSCAECSALLGRSWSIADMPADLAVPPVHADCDCTLVAAET